MAEWFEDEGFWRATYPFMFPDERLALGDEQVEKVLKLAGAAPASALDLGCGPGRHAVPLAGRGVRVTAVDRTSFLLDKARARAREAGVAVEFVEEDMRRFVRPGAFDLVLSVFTSFGYFADDDNALVLRNVAASLAPGGGFVIDVLSKEWLAGHYQPTRSTAHPDGVRLVERTEIVADWTRARTEWIVIQDGTARSWWFDVRIYSGQELRDLLYRAGFAAVTLYGDLDGNPYGLGATRLVALARKEAA
jgi:SAM-dependent methyltransferase